MRTDRPTPGAPYPRTALRARRCAGACMRTCAGPGARAVRPSLYAYACYGHNSISRTAGSDSRAFSGVPQVWCCASVSAICTAAATRPTGGGEGPGASTATVTSTCTIEARAGHGIRRRSRGMRRPNPAIAVVAAHQHGKRWTGAMGSTAGGSTA